MTTNEEKKNGSKSPLFLGSYQYGALTTLLGIVRGGSIGVHHQKGVVTVRVAVDCHIRDVHRLGGNHKTMSRRRMMMMMRLLMQKPILTSTMVSCTPSVTSFLPYRTLEEEMKERTCRLLASQASPYNPIGMTIPSSQLLPYQPSDSPQLHFSRIKGINHVGDHSASLQGIHDGKEKKSNGRSRIADDGSLGNTLCCLAVTQAVLRSFKSLLLHERLG